MNMNISEPNNKMWTILCDFDGTISDVDVTDTLLEAFGQKGWRDLEQQWEQGKIGSQTCMAEQIALLDMSKKELDECLSRIKIDPYFAEFVSAAKQRGIQLHIVSDGLDYAISKILNEHGITPTSIIANHLQQVDERKWGLSFPWYNKDCLKASGTCKCNVARTVANNRFLMIGDGRSDFCVSGIANHVFAKDSLVQECKRLRLSFDIMQNFSVATKLLDNLLSTSTLDVPPMQAVDQFDYFYEVK